MVIDILVAEKASGPITMTKPTPPPPPPASQQPIQSVKQTDSKVAPEVLGGSRQEIRVGNCFSCNYVMMHSQVSLMLALVIC